MAYRPLPPTRRSISQAVISPRPACHHRRTSSGSVTARQTRCAGAANSRSMRIWSAAGRVTFAVPLVATGISLLLLEVFQNVVQQLVALRPQPLVALDPVVDGLQRRTVEAVQPLPPLIAHVHQPHFPEYAQVLGHLRLTEPELEHQVADRPLPAGQQIDDLPAPGLGHRVERVGRGRCSGHARDNTYPYGYASSQRHERADARPAAGRAADLERPLQRLDAVGDPAQSRA